MMTADQLADEINELVPKLKRGSLSVFGDIFGGRIDNVHIVASAAADGDLLVVGFEEGETLQVWDPAGWRIDSHVFTITKASRVRWEWFYYGRERTPDNRFFIEHVLTGATVSVSTDATWVRHPFHPNPTQPAVELLGSF
jgi:hypothetical protein